MGHSTILISLSLVTLLCGLSIAVYQLWSAENARQDQPSALAARFGGKAQGLVQQPDPTPPPVVLDEPPVAPATRYADSDVITVPAPEADSPKKAPRPPRRKPKPDVTHNA